MYKQLDFTEFCEQLGVDPDSITDDDITDYIIELNRYEYREAWFTYINGWD